MEVCTGDTIQGNCVSCVSDLLKSELKNSPIRVLSGHYVLPQQQHDDSDSDSETRANTGILTRESIRKLLDPQGKLLFDQLMATVPKTLYPKSFADFSYDYNTAGELRHTESGAPFAFLTQQHYDALGDVVIQELQARMRTDYKLQELWLPSLGSSDSDSDKKMSDSNLNKISDSNLNMYKQVSGVAQCNVFVSNDFWTNQHKCMVLIQGSGPVRPGMWARALCINDNLALGSIFPYLDRAREQGYSVIVLNPNQNSAMVHEPNVPQLAADVKAATEATTVEESNQDSKTQHAYDYFLNPSHTRHIHVQQTQDQMRSTSKGIRRPVLHNETPALHTTHVWDELIHKLCPAKQLYIVAHSAGGPCTLHLLRERQDEIMPRLRSIAFTDSVHSVSSRAPQFLKTAMKTLAINYITSSEPLGTPVASSHFFSGNTYCKQLSAGHTKHAFTSGTAINAVFKQFTQAQQEANQQQV
jgi:Arb2 domain